MRGKFLFHLAEKIKCNTCSTEVSLELHTAQGQFWLVPEPHNASCGHPCLAGGVEGRSTYQCHVTDKSCPDPLCNAVAPRHKTSLVEGKLPNPIYTEILRRLFPS
jgi:hypothetical protein